MHLNTFNTFRYAIYACFQRSADVLFEITDALLTETVAPSHLNCRFRPFSDACGAVCTRLCKKDGLTEPNCAVSWRTLHPKYRQVAAAS